jgi:hypothetical protein
MLGSLISFLNVEPIGVMVPAAYRNLSEDSITPRKRILPFTEPNWG